MKTTTLLILNGALLVATGAQTTSTIKTSNGTLYGTSCSTKVNSFLGIPFAEAPVGNLRFAPPQPRNQTYTNLDATKAPPACAQFVQGIFSEQGEKSEDCLFLNVWAPTNATTQPDLPVKVWLYGGSNDGGGISDPTYNGCSASENTITVSINYRVGPLGFLSLQSMNLTGNQGIQDQLLGLQWVQENIHAFGGDPSKVLLFGESAGALDTYIISGLPAASSLFHAAIVESGYPLGNLSTADSVESDNQAFVRSLNCSTDDLRCLQSTPVSALNASFFYPNGSLAARADGIRPVVDGTTVPVQPTQAEIKVAIMAGSNAAEEALFLLAQYEYAILDFNATSYDDFLRASYGVLAAPRVNQTYPLSDFASPYDAMAAVLTHSGFRCPARRVLAQAARGGAPAWTYSFNHTPTCPWYGAIPSAALGLLGACHTAEIPFVFGTTDGLPRPGGNCSLTAAEKDVSARMVAAWDGMAARADPGGDWPRYNASASMGVNIEGGAFTASVVDYSMCDFWDSIDGYSNGSSGQSGAFSLRLSIGFWSPAALLMSFAAWAVFLLGGI